MIFLYSGTPGSGKSLHQARDIKHKLAAGKPVIANYAFAWQRLKRCRGVFVEKQNDELSPAWLMQFSRDWFKSHKFREGTISLYIDEAQLMFNCREWDAKNRSEWIKFFTQHRKYGYNIFLIAQFDRMLDRQLRSLIEYEYVHRKVSNFGFWGMLFCLVSAGQLFVSVEVWYPMRQKVGAEWFRYKKSYAQLYDSYLDFDSGESVSADQTAAPETDAAPPDPEEAAASESSAAT